MNNTQSLFHHTDYRVFLKEAFLLEKKRNPHFSHRYLANRLGLATSNFIMLVMQGKRNITPETAFKLTEFLKMSRNETDYFENLVRFCQAKTPKEKDRHYARLLSLRQEMKIDLIEDWQYEYYSHWYNPVVRELLVDDKISRDLSLVAARIVPAIGLREVKRSVKLLLKLKLIRQEGKRYVHSAPFISTGAEVTSVAVANFHRAMAIKAAEAVDIFPKTARNLSACTLRISEKGYEKIVDKINEFRRQVLGIAEQDQATDRVYQMNFQLFPLAKLPKQETLS